MHKWIGSSYENRRHEVTILISLWLSEKMTTDGIRTHALDNQRHTLVLKPRQFFNAGQALDHSAHCSYMCLNEHADIDSVHCHLNGLTLVPMLALCGNEFARLLINILLVGKALSWFNFFIQKKMMVFLACSFCQIRVMLIAPGAQMHWSWWSISLTSHYKNKKQWLWSRSLATTWRHYWWKLTPPIPLSAAVGVNFFRYFLPKVSGIKRCAFSNPCIFESKSEIFLFTIW